MTQWNAYVEYDGTAGEDQAERIVAALPGATVTVDGERNRLAVSMPVEASTLRQATDEAQRAVRAAVAAADVPGQLVQLRVVTLADLQAEIASPRVPDLVGMAEVAAMLEVSKQRAGQVAREHPGFPRPVATPASGPIYVRSAVEAFARGWTRKRTGRPPGSAAKSPS